MIGPFTVQCHARSLLLCLRVPKTGSRSLGAALDAAFAGKRSFYLPNTLEFDGRLSTFQHLRFRRSQVRNLIAHYGTPSLECAFRHIEKKAADGDLLSGGHIDFRTVFWHLTREVRIVTILRNPYDRCRSEYYYARQNQLAKQPLTRLDSSTIPLVAAKFDFGSFVDFLLDHRDVYGDISAAYLGILPCTDIDAFFRRHVFHAGVLERSDQFARALGDKLGTHVQFPHLNASGSEQQVPLTAATKRKLDLLYGFDFAIYEYLLNSTQQRAARVRHRAFG